MLYQLMPQRHESTIFNDHLCVTDPSSSPLNGPLVRVDSGNCGSARCCLGGQVAEAKLTDIDRSNIGKGLYVRYILLYEEFGVNILR